MILRTLAFLALCATHIGPALAQDRDIIPSLAFMVAKEAIPPAMKNPRSAEFDRESVFTDELRGWLPGDELLAFKVSGVVRGTNSFNAVVPNDWTAYVVWDGEKESTALVLFSGKVVYRGKHASAVLEQMAADEAAELKKKTDAFAEAQERRMEQGRRDTEQRRVDSLRSRGRRAGEQMASAMGKAVSRLNDKEAERRARKEATKQKVELDDVEHFVHGYLAGATSVKSQAAAK